MWLKSFSRLLVLLTDQSLVNIFTDLSSRFLPKNLQMTWPFVSDTISCRFSETVDVRDVSDWHVIVQERHVHGF